MEDRNADLLIIGAGPAGLTAAQYGARANLKVLAIEHMAPGGQALLINELENYPGNIDRRDGNGNIIAGLRTGFDLAQDMHSQAESFGASFISEEVTGLQKNGDVYTALVSGGAQYTSLALIIATGAEHRKMGIPGEDVFYGRGVSYCAVCDGSFFKGKTVFVAGGGDSACDAAQYLSRLASQTVIVHRRDRFRAQRALADRVMQNKNIEVRFNTVVKEIKGAQKVSSLVLEQNGKLYEASTDAVFILAGMIPRSSLLQGGSLNAKLDENGYIITDQKMACAEPGLFAAGDVRSGSFRQVVVAAGEGAVAANSAAQYIDSLCGTAYV